jgi:PAS domain S-box-containing protein
MRELAPEHEAHWFETYGRIALTGEPARFQSRAEQLHRTFDVFAFRFGEPEKRQVAILFNDITKRRQMEEALRESEARYRTLFDSIDEGFCIIEVIFDAQERPVDYRLLEINPSFEKQTGLRNALGRRMRELAPEHEAHWYETYGRVAMTGEAVRFQSRAENLNRWYDLYAFRFGAPKNRQVAVLFNDITERKTDAEKIARLNAELLGRARELEAANKELESFSYSVSHDLRAPLRHVQGYVDMLARAAEGQLSEKALRYLKTIADAGAEMGQLIDDLLAFSRMSRKEVEEANVSLDLLVQDAVRSLDIAARGRTIAWKIAPLPQVMGDPALLKQVLANLLGNAVKYSRQRDPAEIEIGCAGKEDGRVILFVRDNGAGFDMQYAHKLFGVFQRLHRSDEFEGTGIGLATVRRIIARHGGRTWGEGKVGEGATFYFTLKPATTS